MLTVYIIGGVVLFIALLLQLRLRIWACFGEKLSVTVALGAWKKQLVPPQAKKEKAKKAAAPGAEKAKKAQLDITVLKGLLPAVWRSVKSALRMGGRRIRITPLELSVITGGDPADAAEKYGLLCAAVCTVMPELEHIVHIPDPHIHLDIDYGAEKTAVTGQVGIRLRLADCLAIGVAAAGPLLGWLMHRKKTAPETKTKIKNDGNSEIAA